MNHQEHSPDRSLEIDFSIQAPIWNKHIGELESQVHNVIRRTLDTAKFRGRHAEISLVFADDAFIRELNKTYRGKDKPTNVLSFPQYEPKEIPEKIEGNLPFISLGDIVLAYETIEREAQEQEKSFEDHFLHLIVHGLLHLLGHDHEEDDEAEIMENLEIRILEGIGIKNPYESGDFMR